MTLENLIYRTQVSLSKHGLCLSDFGIEEMTKRWNKKEDQGGFSNSIKDSNYEKIDVDMSKIWQDRLSEINKTLT